MIVRNSGRPRVDQDAYPASVHNHMDSGLGGQWMLSLGFPYVDILRHTISFGDVRDMEITNTRRGCGQRTRGMGRNRVEQSRSRQDPRTIDSITRFLVPNLDRFVNIPPGTASSEHRSRLDGYV
jgi:hypothetical protein